MDKYIGRLLDNRYEIIEVKGTGGMAVVYKALCHRLNRFVAVKILREDLALDSEFIRRFQSESLAVAKLSHPNIVAVYDVSKSTDTEYIVMELVDGITLKQYMKKKGALSWKETLHFSIQIAKAISHAHEKGIIHRDIKPQNIMILNDGTIKVADFGIAHLENEQAEELQETLGSVHYISPEQAKGSPADARSDLYSLGIVMYEMLAGSLPYEGETAMDIALQHIGSSPVPLREINEDIPEELEGITAKAMSSDIAERYQSASELLVDLESFRKAQSAVLNSAAAAGAGAAAYPQNLEVSPDVKPISTSGELSKEDYQRRSRRSKKVSMLSGFFCVLVFILVIFIFLWNFWLKDLFSDSVRIDMPEFIGSNYEDIVNSPAYTLFNFTVTFSIDPNTPEGIIIAQSPDAGKSVAKSPEGIDVKLTISTGVMMVSMPDVVNTEYRTATMELQSLGFVVEPSTEASDTVTKDYVIRTNPLAGENLPAGSTVYITVSGGPETVPVRMPSLIGLTQSAAIARIESSNLSLGTISSVESDLPEGTVIWQSVEAYTEVEEHTKVFLQISSGPKPSPSPSETIEPSEPADPGETDEPVQETPPVPSPSAQVTDEPSIPVGGAE